MEWVLRLLTIHLAICLVPVFVGSCVLALERGEPIGLTRNGTSGFFREWAAHLLILPMLCMGLLPSRPRMRTVRSDIAEGGEVGATRVPVLLVHGYGLNRACWWFLKTYLHTRGWSWVWAINHRPLSRPIPLYAERLSRAVDRLRSDTGAQRIDLVAHSMGGLIAAWYMAKLGGADKVRRLVTLGTPWRGTRTHVFALWREGRDLAPHAQVVSDVQDLDADIVAIWSQSDHLVIPTESAAPTYARAVEIPHLGHLEMLVSARAFRAVADALTHPSEE